MRITQDLLQKIVQDTIRKRQRSEPDLLAAYLTGSLLREDPLLGGTTDIDLVLVHKYQIPLQRETLPVTPEVSLDIIHKLQDDYENHKQLRHDAWLGYPLTRNHILLYDSEHWLEFIQAGVSAQFHRPENVMARVNRFSTAAREGWFELMQISHENHLRWLDHYLSILALAANAIVGLNGPPLTTRRFMMDFSEQAQILGVPKILAGFSGLLGISEETLTATGQWREALQNDLTLLSKHEKIPQHLSPCRHAYYLDAIQALSESGYPEYAIWPLLRIWVDVLMYMQANQKTDLPIWEACINALGLSTGSTETKFEALDAFLDNVQIVIETWGEKYGI